MTKKKFTEICLETYRMLYKAATPSADFDELVENCTTFEDANGKEIGFHEKLSNDELRARRWRRVIDYDAYYRDKYKEIVEAQAKKYKLRNMWKQGFDMEMYLGCGPTSHRPEEGKEAA